MSMILRSALQRFFLTLKKGHKPETFVVLKNMTLFDISLPSITLSAIEVQVSPIPEGFSVKLSFERGYHLSIERMRKDTFSVKNVRAIFV